MPLAAHHRQDGGQAVEHPVEVHRQHPRELVGAEVLGEVLLALDARVVEERVDRAELIDGRGNIGADVGLVSDVSGPGHNPPGAAPSLDVRLRRVEGVGVDVDQQQVGAFSGDALSGPPTETRPCARDDHRLVLEPVHDTPRRCTDGRQHSHCREPDRKHWPPPDLPSAPPTGQPILADAVGVGPPWATRHRV